MPATRRSARLGSSQGSSPTQQQDSPKTGAGAKRKSEQGSSPAAKRGKKGAPKQQQTIEESMDVDAPVETPTKPTDNENKAAEADSHQNGEKSATQAADVDTTQKQQSAEKEPSSTASENKEEKPMMSGAQQDSIPQETKTGDKSANSDAGVEKPKQNGDTKDDKSTHPASEMDGTGTIKPTEDAESHEKSGGKPAANGDSAVEPHARDDDTPSSILEKGIIYFFMRGRVGIDNPSEPDDVARSYIVLRPIPHGAKIGEGAISNAEGKCRLLALPKKVLPLSGKDRFMTFVENAKTSFQELKDSFLGASDYATKTAGDRHTPAATPIAEGVYAITTTGRESHLAYILTLPTELGDVQKDMGLREQGSFVTSAKNPQYAGPANTNLPQGPDFPKEILDEFRSLRWAPLQPKFLDYENTQFLLIGESSGIENALKPNNKDQGEGEAKEEMEKLEGEDEIRIKHLHGNDAVFADLGVSKNDYPKLQTTW